MQTSLKKVVVTKGVMSSLDVFADGLIHGFELLDYEVLIFDNKNVHESLELIEQFLDKDIVGIVTLNNYAINFSYSTGENVWEKHGIWCIDILVDHPLYYHDEISNLPSKSALLCVDINHMKYVERFYPNIRAIGMMAHGGRCIYDSIKPIDKRSIDILYAGALTIEDYGNFRPHVVGNDEKEIQLIEEAYNDIYQLMINNPKMTYEYAVESYLQQNHIAYDDKILLEYLRYFVRAEKHAVSYYRANMIKNIACSGLPITICGGRWDKLDWINLPNVTYIGVVSPLEVLDLMADAKIVVNSMPWFKNGSHERVYNGMLQGAVVVTDKSMYFSNISSMIEQVELSELAELPSIIRGLLDNPDRMQKMADAAVEYSKNNDSWECRAKEISEAFFVNE